MNIHCLMNPSEFLDLAGSYLEAQEIANCLILGVAIRLKEHPEWTDVPPYLGIVDDEDTVKLAAIITPPQNLLLAGEPNIEPLAFDLLINNLTDTGWNIPGIVAEKILARRFADAWKDATSSQPILRTRLRAYELRQVILPDPLAIGHLRKATMEDLDILSCWRAEFIRESIRQEPPSDTRDQASRFIFAGNTYVWDIGQPVSMAGLTRPTPHGISIGSVYTPPEFRQKGYASACVATLSQLQLDQGKSYCGLFADLDYDTSNSIYQKIGYRMTCDFSEYNIQYN